MDKTMEKNAEGVLDTETSEELVEQEAEEHETDSTSETPIEEEQASEETGEGDEEGGDSEDDEVAKLRERLNRAHRQIERLKTDSVRKVEKGKVAPASGSETHIEKALLAAYGFKAREDQEMIRELARKAGMDTAEALEDEFVMSRFEHMKKQEQVQRAASRPSGKAMTAKKSPSYYIERGVLPKDPEQAKAVRAELARRAREQYS